MWRGMVAGFILISSCRAAELIVQLPVGETVHVANAVERGSQVIRPGAIGSNPSGSTAEFKSLQTGTTYDLAIETESGQLLCGVDLSWCDSTPADPQAEPLGDDDRAAIASIVKDIKGFANKPSIVRLVGDHDRAIALVNLVRDNGFHSNVGDEVIWRAEVWFFHWENGGWERVANQSRVLRRERFANHTDFQTEVERIRWLPSLGGILISGDSTQTIQVNSAELSRRATKASSSTAESHSTTLFSP